LMHAGFSLVEAGFTRAKNSAKNTANILMKNMMTVCIGVLIYWLVGWAIMYGESVGGIFGFNCGSTLDGSDAYMNLVVANTFLAAAAAAISVMIITWMKTGKPDPSLTANGVLAGLVAITAPCGSVENWAAIVIGIVAGAIAYAGVLFNEAVLKVDDPVGAIAVHGYCGTWGLLAVGIFSVGMGNGIPDGAVYAAGAPGLLYGGVNQFMVQVVGALAAVIWAFVAGLIVFKLIDVVIGLRVSEREELEGLDVTEHGIRAYPEYITE